MLWHTDDTDLTDDHRFLFSDLPIDRVAKIKDLWSSV